MFFLDIIFKRIEMTSSKYNKVDRGPYNSFREVDSLSSKFGGGIGGKNQTLLRKKINTLSSRATNPRSTILTTGNNPIYNLSFDGMHRQPGAPRSHINRRSSVDEFEDTMSEHVDRYSKYGANGSERIARIQQNAYLKDLEELYNTA